MRFVLGFLLLWHLDGFFTKDAIIGVGSATCHFGADFATDFMLFAVWLTSCYGARLMWSSYVANPVGMSSMRLHHPWDALTPEA
jgi:hypothetical protein